MYKTFLNSGFGQVFTKLFMVRLKTVNSLTPGWFVSNFTCVNGKWVKSVTLCDHAYMCSNFFKILQWTTFDTFFFMVWLKFYVCHCSAVVNMGWCHTRVNSGLILSLRPANERCCYLQSNIVSHWLSANLKSSLVLHVANWSRLQKYNHLVAPAKSKITNIKCQNLFNITTILVLCHHENFTWKPLTIFTICPKKLLVRKLNWLTPGRFK